MLKPWKLLEEKRNWVLAGCRKPCTSWSLRMGSLLVSKIFHSLALLNASAPVSFSSLACPSITRPDASCPEFKGTECFPMPTSGSQAHLPLTGYKPRSSFKSLLQITLWETLLLTSYSLSPPPCLSAASIELILPYFMCWLAYYLSLLILRWTPMVQATIISLSSVQWEIGSVTITASHQFE